MTACRPVVVRETLMGRLASGCDLLEELTRVCVERNVRLGRVEALGAVRRARVAFYDQALRQYGFTTLDRPMEITQLLGNVSLKDGQPFVHAHVTLVDAAGQVHGGHLASGTTVFACEFVIQAFDGPSFERGPDAETGLALWTLPPA